MQDLLRFDDFLHARPKPRGIDVLCKLQHFAIITYAVEPERFEGLLPNRFRLDTVEISGESKGLISVVPFIDVDFTSAVFPFPKFRMGQTNYRIYVVDTNTGERCVWFLGTTLDSWTLVVPRYLWNLPWYPGAVRFECEIDPQTGRYRSYHMRTDARWAPAEVRLSQPKGLNWDFAGFPDEETALVFLTHPLSGFYHRRDGKLGTYRVWHDRLRVAPAKLESAFFGLLERGGIVTRDEQQCPHSVLLEPINEFTIYLPPKVLRPEI